MVAGLVGDMPDRQADILATQWHVDAWGHRYMVSDGHSSNTLDLVHA